MIVHNTATTLIVVLAMINKSQASTFCDLTITTSSCLCLRIPTITAIIVVSLASFTVVCSHSVQLVTTCKGFCRFYENTLGIGFIIIASAGTSAYIFYEEVATEIKPYCIAESSHNRDKMLTMYETLAIVDVTCAILCFALVAATRHKLQSNSHEFKLSLHFELRSNARALKTNLIKCLVRIFIFDTFLFLNFVIRVVIDRTTNRLGYTEWVNANYNIQVYAILYAILIQYDRKIVTSSRRVIDSGAEADQYHQEMMKTWLTDIKR
ncbi:unnamed protein product [Bursaphelenchus xylophilus]|nr:unnamed protein product [Bursaphelenchus xylophilus]CAG9100196.1 unnamed protein product [Bursaphelenchus xylophilus]